MTLPEATPHPLKKDVQERGIKLWQLKQMTGTRYPEPRLSRFLNGIEPMPETFERQIMDVLK